jgi:DNA-binding response OmpR family regulator
MVEGFEGQFQPAPGFLKVWKLAHDGRLCAYGDPDLTAGSAFPQETLNLLLCERGFGGVTARLLVVDDEPRTAELTAEVLRRAGYAVEVAGSGTEALERVRSGSPDLMLLDYEMPDMEAPEVLDSLRSGAERIPFPVIILTGARHSPADQVVGIERGATDFIVKGTDRQVMLARVRGALRERSARPGAVVRGRLHVDASRGEARLGDRPLKLERRPLLMLQLLALRSGEVISRAELLEKVWGSSYTGFEHSLEQAVHQVRRQLGEPGWIVTVRGIGYRFVVVVG